MNPSFFSIAISLPLISVAAHAQTYIFGRADFAVGNVPVSVATGDSSGDGLVDLAATNSSDNNMALTIVVK